MRKSFFLRPVIATAALLAMAAFAFVPAAVAGPVQVNLNNLTFTNQYGGSAVFNGSFLVDSTTDSTANILEPTLQVGSYSTTIDFSQLSAGTFPELYLLFQDGYGDYFQLGFASGLSPAIYGPADALIQASSAFATFGFDQVVQGASSGSFSIASPTVTSAPEPTSLVLLLTGLAAVLASAALRRRDRLAAEI